MSVSYIYERSPIAAAFDFIAQYQKNNSSQFLETLQSQLAKVLDDDFLVVEKSPFCTHVIDANQDLQTALGEYYTYEQRQFSGYWDEPCVVSGRQYKEWCERNIDNLMHWADLAEQSNGLMALGFDDDSPEFKKIDEDYCRYRCKTGPPRVKMAVLRHCQ